MNGNERKCLFAPVIAKTTRSKLQFITVIQEVIKIFGTHVFSVHISECFVEVKRLDEFGCRDGCAAEFVIDALRFSGVVSGLCDTWKEFGRTGIRFRANKRRISDIGCRTNRRRFRSEKRME